MAGADRSSFLADIIRYTSERKAADTRFQRANRRYAALSQCNKAVVRSTGEDELFARVCRVAVQFGGMKMAWIGLVDSATRTVRPVASFDDGVEHAASLLFGGCRQPVRVCRRAVEMTGQTEATAKLGFELEYARDVFIRYALENATVIRL